MYIIGKIIESSYHYTGSVRNVLTTRSHNIIVCLLPAPIV